jgi:phosphate/sulfate permease
MAFAANDLVNFIGVPLAGMSAYDVAMGTGDPLNVTMGALQKKVHTDTVLLLLAGTIMVITLWVSRKARTVTKTEINLGRQDEGSERFESSALSRIIVRMILTPYNSVNKFIPTVIRRIISRRMDPGVHVTTPAIEGQAPSFDLLRASVNLVVASAVVSFATSLKLPLSTTYVTFMVAMGTSLSDQAWGRESAVYRVTGVLTVIGGWFFTAFAAFTVSLIFAVLLYFLKLPAIVGLLLFTIVFIVKSYRWHFKKEEETKSIEAFSLKNINDAKTAVGTSFEQTGLFLKEISDTLGVCFESAFSEDRHRLKEIKSETDKIQKWASVIVANIFKTLFLLHKENISSTQKYSHTIRSLQAISESHRDIILRVHEHFDNHHKGFTDEQQRELRTIKTHVTRLLWNTSIMLLSRKKIDYNYIANQSRKLNDFINEFDKNQIKRIQNNESKTRLSILFYGIMENCTRIAERTQDLLDIFKDSLESKQ